MQRTTISLPEDLHRRLRILAAERGISLAEFMREAAEEKATRVRPKPRSLGMAASGYTDTARESADMKFEPRSWR